MADARERFVRLAAPDVTWLSGGVVALVAAAGDVVLKVVPRGFPGDAELLGEGRALEVWRPTGAVVPLLDLRDDGFTLVLQRLRPGTPLDAAPVSPDERLRVLGGLVRRLHAVPAPTGFVPVAEYGRAWPEVLAGTPELAELLELAEPRPGDVLLHGDLHGGNVLAAGTGWQVIDPHAVLGDPHFDVWGLIDPLSPTLAEPGRAPRDVHVYAEAAGLDPARAAAWTRIRAVVEVRQIGADATAGPDELDWAARLHRVASALR